MKQLLDVLRDGYDGQKDRTGVAEALTDSEIACARANKISGLVARWIRPGELSEQARAGLLLDQQRASLSNAHLLHYIHLASAALETVGIEYFFYKGPIQQKLLYGDFYAKQSADADLMVQPHDFDRARLALGAAGFKLAPKCEGPWWRYFLGEQHLFYGVQKGHSLDLHYKLQQPGCPAPARIERFFDLLTYVDLGASAVPTLSPIGVALIAAMNFVKAMHHREPAGSYAIDLMTTLSAMTEADLSDLRAEAKKQKLTKTMAVASRAISIAFDAPDRLTRGAVRLPAHEKHIAGLVLHPASVPEKTLKRTYLLFCLCDDLGQFVYEGSRWAVSEACRIFLQNE